MNLGELSIKKPIFITMVIMACVVLGLKAVNEMPVDLFPDIEIPYVTVVTVYPGASPEEIETLIADKLEDELTTLSDLKNITSESLESVSIVMMEFTSKADLEEKVADVRDKVEAMKDRLPDDAEDPRVLKFDLDSFPILFAAVSAPRHLSEVKTAADDVIKPYMERIPGVASIGVSGGLEREIHVDVDRNKLVGYNLSILQVVQALAKDNLNIPAGKIKKGTDETLVRVLGEYADVSEIEAVNIPTPMGIIKISDIATVSDGYKDIPTYSRLNGNNSVSLQVVKQSDANTVATARAVKAAMKELTNEQPVLTPKQIKKIEKKAAAKEKRRIFFNKIRVKLGKEEVQEKKVREKVAILPSDYKIKVAMDMSRFIEDSLADVKSNLFYGCIFATLMVLLFLRDFRSTFIVFVAIPIAIVSSFMPMYVAGFSINFMSLMGMALAVGTLVDNSIVVLENIFRHLEMGKHPKQAAADGLKEVGLAVLVSGTTNVCVYMSVAFMSGTTGAFFKEFGLTIAFATLFAIFVAFTMTPALAAKLYKVETDENGDVHINKKENGNGNGNGNGSGNGGKPGLIRRTIAAIWFIVTLPVVVLFKYLVYPAFDLFNNAIQKAYPGILSFCVRRRWVLVLIVLGMFMSAMHVAKLIPQEYVPGSDQGELYVLYELPSYASLDDTDAVSKQVENMLKELPEVAVYSTAVGEKIGRGSLEGQSQPRFGWTTVQLVDLKDRTKTTEDIVRIVRRKVSNIPDTIFQVSQSSMGGPPGELPMMIDVVGPDLKTLVPLAERVEKIVKETEGALDVTSSWLGGKSEIQIFPDKEKMASMGLDIATVGYTVRVSLEGDNSIQFKDVGDEYDIRIRFDGAERESVENVRAIPIMTMNGAIRLDNIADVRQELGPVTIFRKKGQPAIRIQGNLGDKTIAEVVQSIEDRIVREDFLPAGYDVQYEGQYAEMNEMGKEMGMAMGLAILFVFMVMAAQFESLLYPFVVMFTLPLTFIGVAWALFLSGNTFNMMTQIGIVMLIGIVVNNGILLVDFINQIRERGTARNNAILEAGPLRLRPILITSFSTIGAMIPAAFFAGSGGGMRTPMAMTAIGGMIVSTFLTLVVIPVMYTLIDDMGRFVMRKLGRKLDPVWEHQRAPQKAAEGK